MTFVVDVPAVLAEAAKPVAAAAAAAGLFQTPLRTESQEERDAGGEGGADGGSGGSACAATPADAGATATPAVPFKCGPITVVSWGRVEPLGKYHSTTTIFPVGFCSERMHDSFVTAGAKTLYTSKVLADGECDDPILARAVFRVTAADAPGEVFQGRTASNPWTSIAQRAYALKHASDENEEEAGPNATSPSKKKRKHKVDLGGPAQYGFTRGDIKWVLDAMPRADECAKYKRLAARGETRPKAKKAKKAKAKKAPKPKKEKAPKAARGKSAYLFFTADKRAELVATEEGAVLKQTELMKRIGALWQDADAEARAPFVALAATDKIRAAAENAAAAPAAAAPAAPVVDLTTTTAASGAISKWTTAQPTSLAAAATAAASAQPAVPEVPDERVAPAAARLAELVADVTAIARVTLDVEAHAATITQWVAEIAKYGVDHTIPSGTTAFTALVATLAEGQTAPLDALAVAIARRISAEGGGAAASAAPAPEATAAQAAAAPPAPLVAIDAATVKEKLLVVSERSVYGMPLAPGARGDKSQLKLTVAGDADGERIVFWEARNPMVLPSSDGEKKQLAAAKKQRKAVQGHIKAVRALLKLLRLPPARRAAASAAIAKAEAGVRKHETKLEAAKTKRLAAERKASAAAAAKEEKAAMLRIQKEAAAKAAEKKKAARVAAKEAAREAAAVAKEEREAAKVAAAAKKRAEKEAAAAAKEAKKLADKEAAARKAHIAKTAGSASILSMFKTIPKAASPAKAKAMGAASSPGAAAAPCAAELARIAALDALDAALDEAWGGSPADRATLKRKREAAANGAPTPAARADVVEVDASGAPRRKMRGGSALNFRIGQQSVDSHSRGWGSGSNAAHAKRGALSDRRKLLGFADDDENDRPPFFGSLLRRWRVRACTPETMTALNERLKLSDLRRDAQAISATVSFRRPFARDDVLLAYDEDSCEDWGVLDEGEGEDLDHTDDEAEAAEEDDYELDGFLCSDEDVELMDEGEEGGEGAGASGGGGGAASGRIGKEGQKWKPRAKVSLFLYRYISCESFSQFDSLPITYFLTI